VLYLRGSLHVMPFFSEPSLRLASPLPPDSIELLLDTKGEPILPGAPDDLLVQGTLVSIEKVEFPTGMVVTKRPLYSPRTNPWVYFHLAGQPRGRPYVAVLRPGIKTREEFLAVMEQLFCAEDPAIWTARFPLEIKTALREKRLVRGMDAQAVELAWGRPETIKQEYVESVKVETWTWPLGKRQAVLRDGKLVEAKPALE